MNKERILSEIGRILEEENARHKYVVMARSGRVVTIQDSFTEAINHLPGAFRKLEYQWLQSGRAATQSQVSVGVDEGKIALITKTFKALVFRLPAYCYLYQIQMYGEASKLMELSQVVDYLYHRRAFFTDTMGESSCAYGEIVATSLLRGEFAQLSFPTEPVIYDPDEGDSVLKEYIRRRELDFIEVPRGKINIQPLRGESRRLMQDPLIDLRGMDRFPEAVARLEDFNDGTQTTTSSEERHEEP